MRFRISEQPTDEHLCGVGNDDLAQAMIAHGSGGNTALDGVLAWPRMQSDPIQASEADPGGVRSR
jgi:hypothetical protein